MAARKPPEAPAAVPGDGGRVAQLEAEIAALARVVLALAVHMPGPPQTTRRVLTDELKASHADTDRVIAAAQRTE